MCPVGSAEGIVDVNVSQFSERTSETQYLFLTGLHLAGGGETREKNDKFLKNYRKRRYSNLKIIKVMRKYYKKKIIGLKNCRKGGKAERKNYITSER